MIMAPLPGSSLLRRIFQQCLPFLSVLGLVLVAVGPLSMVGHGIHIMVISAVIYGWLLYHPESIPLGGALVFGLFFDLMSMGLPGITSLVWVALVWGARDRRHWLFCRVFILNWLVFALVMAMVAIVYWLLTCVAFLSILSIQPMLLGFIAVLLMFPLIARAVNLFDDGLEPHG